MDWSLRNSWTAEHRALRDKIEAALKQLEGSERPFLHPAEADASIMKSKEQSPNIATCNAQAGRGVARTVADTGYATGHEFDQAEKARRKEPERKTDLKKRGYLIDPVFGLRRLTNEGLDLTHARRPMECTPCNLANLCRHWIHGKGAIPTSS